MKTNFKLLIAASTLALLAACGNNTSEESATTAVALTVNPSGNTPAAQILAVDAYTPPVTSDATNLQQQPTTKARDLSAAPVPAEVNLGAPETNKLKSAIAKNKLEDSSIPLTAGIGRNIAQTRNSELTKQLLSWKNTPSGGSVAAIKFNSPGAKGLRIGVLVTKLPEAATLRFYAKGASQAIELKASEVLGNLELNRAAGDTSDAGRTFWSPRIDGAEGVVEIELPADANIGDVEISIPILSHLFLSTSAIVDKFATTYTWPNDGLTCEIDINCSAPVPAVSNAVAAMVFTNSDGGTAYCTGTLLNDATSSGTPYFATANHCISTQTVASTLGTLWFYKSSSCNSTSGNYYLGTTSATLLFTAQNTDGTLLRLNGAPPAGVMYAGWDATPPVLSTAVSGIHHPRADAQRISSGNILSYSVITSRTATGYSWSPSDIANSNLVRTSLLTENGSSGSALFKNITSANPQVIGQLLGGPTAVCGAANYADYGRFDKSFNSGMSDWLAPSTRKVKTDFNANGKSDLVWTGLNSGGTFLQMGQPLTFQAPKLLINSGVSTMHTGDFNGDGHADIVYTSANGQQIEVVLLKNGYRMSSQFHSPSSSWPVAGVGDFDGDGKSDLIFRNPITGQIIYWLMDGVSVKTNSGPKPVSPYWFIKGLGDVNGDGKDDVVWMNPWTGEQAIHLMNGTTYTLAGYQFVAIAWEIHGVGDFNGDGKADIIWRYPLTGQVFIYFMNGGTIASTASYGISPNWKIRQTGDYDGDGKSDVLWQNENTGTLVTHLMNGGVIKSAIIHQLDEAVVKIQ